MSRQSRGINKPPLPSHGGAGACAEVESAVFFISKKTSGLQPATGKPPTPGHLANGRFVNLGCYLGCSDKWEFLGHNSSHPKAAVQKKLSETPLECGDRNDTQPWG